MCSLRAAPNACESFPVTYKKCLESLKCKRLTLADEWMNYLTGSDISSDKTCYNHISLNLQIPGDDSDKAWDNE